MHASEMPFSNEHFIYVIYKGFLIIYYLCRSIVCIAAEY